MNVLDRSNVPPTLTIRTFVPTLLLLVASAVRLQAQVPAVPTLPEAQVLPTAAVVERLAPEGCLVTDCSHKSYTLWETISGSLCSKEDPCRPWKPLDFGIDGWNEPWISPPNGDSGAVRQGWINDMQAFFNRNVFGVYNYGVGAKGLPNTQQAIGVFESPLSRRYMFGVVVPALNSIDGGGAPSKTAFGDVTFENRYMLTETENLSLSLNLSVQTPTGERTVGADRTILFPFVAFWTDVGHGWSVRGGVGFQAPVDDKPNHSDGVIVVNACLGQTLTKHDATPFGDLTYFVCTNLLENVGNTDHTIVTLTPGFRTHLGHNWFLLGGIQVSVTSPKAFDEQLTAVLVKGW